MEMQTDIVPRTRNHSWWLGCVTLIVLVAVVSLRGRAASEPATPLAPAITGTAEEKASSDQTQPPKPFPVTIRQPSGSPTIELKQTDPLGRAGEVACSTCHSVRKPDFTNREPTDLELFHQRMKFDHGKIACYACHNPDDADTLRLADSTPVEYANVMQLCAQCHGTQARDYAHGAHGGMTGYWDLSRGPRLRNNCIDCHDPHVPKFPTMLPTFKPRDRFLNPNAPPHRESHGE